MASGASGFRAMTISPWSVVIKALYSLEGSSFASPGASKSSPVGVSSATGDSVEGGGVARELLLPMLVASPVAARLAIVAMMKVA
jgi:hypothetical protein